MIETRKTCPIHSPSASSRYGLLEDPTGWTVWDSETDGPVLFGGEILSGQSRMVADILLAFLDDIEISRAAGRRRLSSTSTDPEKSGS
ncbi:hypothetical protein [Rhizobium sp. WYJ-E13]|uniref:hypothetical protein n=1 Tax=Rhizobium sp. WYJ-E13 TaxID=2849093 RepID=UPI001C1F0997|nr:hypothetical protein [Rhizobium sp. WYJ-E13]QWW72280.1 hypothetical protein KQ933_32390 [Rhizobium sp. WYJ-E13]